MQVLNVAARMKIIYSQSVTVCTNNDGIELVLRHNATVRGRASIDVSFSIQTLYARDAVNELTREDVSANADGDVWCLWRILHCLIGMCGRHRGSNCTNTEALAAACLWPQAAGPAATFAL